MKAYVGLGANLGDRRANIAAALEMLRARGVRPGKVSGLIETLAIGGPPGQPNYLNGAAEVETDLDAAALLAVLLDVESALGRRRREGEKDAPRPIDLDLLFYGAEAIAVPGLTVPHPRLHKRMFVLAPLCEIASDLVHPVLGKTVAELAEDLAESK